MKIQGYVSLELGQMRTSFLKIKKFLSWTTTNQNSKNRGGKPIMHQHMLKNKIKFFYKKFSSNLFVSRICAYLGHDHESYLDFTVSRRTREMQWIFTSKKFKTCSYRNFWKWYPKTLNRRMVGDPNPKSKRLWGGVLLKGAPEALKGPWKCFWC